MKKFSICFGLIVLIVLNSICVFADNISYGSRGTEVRYLQMNLNFLNYPCGTADGICGNNTVNAIKNYQRDNGLTVDGIAGNATKNSLNNKVKDIQNKLNSKGYNPGTIDGIAGTNTVNALKNFQRDNGLTVDGICGKQSLDQLNNAASTPTTSEITTTTISTFANTPSNVVTYSLKADGNKKLSANFKVSEFRCHDGSDTILIDHKLVALLQDIRNHFGKPLYINSAYRSPSYNASIENAAKNSKHMLGIAADIRVSGVSAKEVAKYAESIGVRGIGLYDSGYVHVDTRTTKWFWRNNGNNGVATFR